MENKETGRVRTYLLDTCVFLWLITDGPGRLTSKAKQAVTSEESDLLMSSVSLVEMAILAEKGRICMARIAPQRGLESLRVSGMLFRDGDALRYFSLPENDQHCYPFDPRSSRVALGGAASRDHQRPPISRLQRSRGYLVILYSSQRKPK